MRPKGSGNSPKVPGWNRNYITYACWTSQMYPSDRQDGDNVPDNIFQEYVFMDENMGNSVRITLEYYSKISYEQLIYTLCKESKTKHWNMRKFSNQWCIWITGLQCVNRPSNLGRFGSHVLMLLHVQKISTNTEMIVEIKLVTVGFPSQKAKNAPSTFNCHDTIMCSCN